MNELKEQFTPVNTAKFLTGTLASIGATAVVIAALKNPLNSSKGITKLLMKLGIFVIACKVGDMAEKYVNDTFEDAEKTFKEATEKDLVKGTDADA